MPEQRWVQTLSFLLGATGSVVCVLGLFSVWRVPSSRPTCCGDSLASHTAGSPVVRCPYIRRDRRGTAIVFLPVHHGLSFTSSQILRHAPTALPGAGNGRPGGA